MPPVQYAGGGPVPPARNGLYYTQGALDDGEFFLSGLRLREREQSGSMRMESSEQRCLNWRKWNMSRGRCA